MALPKVENDLTIVLYHIKISPFRIILPFPLPKKTFETSNVKEMSYRASSVPLISYIKNPFGYDSDSKGVFLRKEV